MKLLEQALPQEIPAGFEVTRPEPLPDRLSVRVLRTRVKVAVADRVWFMVTVQVPVPVHAPDQPTKREPVAGVAERMIVAPWLKPLEQVKLVKYDIKNAADKRKEYIDKWQGLVQGR